jgi:hypothetical protein
MLRHSLRRTWSTPHSAFRIPPCIWTFLSSLLKGDFFGSLLEGGPEAGASGVAACGAEERTGERR